MKMRSMINKIIIGLVVLGLTSATTFTIPAQAAAEQTTTKILNIDSLIKEVLNNNQEIKLMDSQIKVQESRCKLATQKANEIKTNEWQTGDIGQSKQYVLLFPLQAKNQLDELKWQKENKLMGLKAETTKLYHQYIFKQREVDAQSKAVERAKAELLIEKEKVKLGKVSSLALTQNENAVELSDQKLAKLNSELKSIAMNINSLLNYDLDQKVQFNSETIKIDEYTVKDLEALIDKRKVESNTILKLQRDIEEAKIQYYVESFNRGNISSNYELLEDKPKELENQIQTEQYNIEQKIRIDYNNILAAYEDIAIAKLSYDLNIKLFDVAEKKYQQKTISYIDYLKATEDKENAIVQYEQTQLKYLTSVLDFKLYIEQL